MLYLGKRDDTKVDPLMDCQKVLGAGPGGTVEIHGRDDRLSWTKIASTLEAVPRLYDSADQPAPSDSNGFVFYEFTPEGHLVRTESGIMQDTQINEFFTDVSSDSVVILAKQRNFKDKKWQKVADLEAAIAASLRTTADVLNLDKVGKNEAWTVLADMTELSGLQESYNVLKDDDPDGCITDILTLNKGGITFRTQTMTNPDFVSGGKNKITVEVFVNRHDIETLDDVSSWETGDQVMLWTIAVVQYTT